MVLKLHAVLFTRRAVTDELPISESIIDPVQGLDDITRTTLELTFNRDISRGETVSHTEEVIPDCS